MRNTSYRAATRWHAITDELVAPVDIEQLKLHGVRVFASLFDAPNDHCFNAEDRPISKIYVYSRRRLLQHVVDRQRRETAASVQIVADHLGYIQRHIRSLTLPAERHYRDRAPFDALSNLNDEFGIC